VGLVAADRLRLFAEPFRCTLELLPSLNLNHGILSVRKSNLSVLGKILRLTGVPVNIYLEKVRTDLLKWRSVKTQGGNPRSI
jgi:hypothetical protein